MRTWKTTSERLCIFGRYFLQCHMRLPCFQATFPSTGELEQQFTFLEMFSGARKGRTQTLNPKPLNPKP